MARVLASAAECVQISLTPPTLLERRFCNNHHSSSPSVILIENPFPDTVAQMKRTMGLSIFFGTALAVAFWLSLEISDAIFQSRLLPWIRPLIHVQDIGFRVAARLFRCQMEGFDTGCEAYKRLPTFVGANAAAYSIILFPIIRFWRGKARENAGQRQQSNSLQKCAQHRQAR